MIRIWQMLAAMTPGGSVAGAILAPFAAVVRGVLWLTLWVARSARAAFAVPMTYPIIAVVGFGGFIGGHIEGAKPAKGLHAELVKVVVERDRMAKQLTVTKSDLAAATERIRLVEVAQSVSPADVGTTVAAVPARPRAKPAVRPAPKAEAPGIVWPFKF